MYLATIMRILDIYIISLILILFMIPNITHMVDWTWRRTSVGAGVNKSHSLYATYSSLNSQNSGHRS